MTDFTALTTTTQQVKLLPPLSLRLPPALVADLDGQAARLGCSRAELARRLLEQESKKLQEQFNQEDQLQSPADQ